MDADRKRSETAPQGRNDMNNREKKYARLRRADGFPTRSPLGFVYQGYMARTTAFERADIPESKIPSGAIRLDENYANPDAEARIYAWMEGDGTIRCWTDAEAIMLTDETARMFSHLISARAIDMSMFDTSQVTDMSSMFYDCVELEHVDLSRFDTSEVIYYQ